MARAEFLHVLFLLASLLRLVALVSVLDGFKVELVLESVESELLCANLAAFAASLCLLLLGLHASHVEPLRRHYSHICRLHHLVVFAKVASLLAAILIIMVTVSLHLLGGNGLFNGGLGFILTLRLVKHVGALLQRLLINLFHN